jgi:5-methylcytosine-specific restriction endonuclease McrA
MSKKRVDNTIRRCPVCGDAMSDDDPQEFCCPLCERIGGSGRTWSLPAPQDEDRVCPTCGTVFTPSSARHVFCSKKCSQEKSRIDSHDKYHQRAVARDRGERTCAECGSTFTPSTWNQIYCSAACSTAKVKREYHERAYSYVAGLIATHEARGAGAMPTEQRLAQLYESARASGHCPYCGGATDEWTLDHIVPVSRGGTNLLHNLIFVCPRCNSTKGARSLDMFLATHLPHTLGAFGDSPA